MKTGYIPIHTPAVIMNEFAEAAKLVEKIGANDEDISTREYATFPLFSEFRKSKDFTVSYKKTFGKEFVGRELFEPKKPMKKRELEKELEKVKNDKTLKMIREILRKTELKEQGKDLKTRT